jgi:formylglycine-generating enzyme required for sulfatase activity
MHRLAAISLAVVAISLALGPPVSAIHCSPDAVLIGPTCVDKYEATVWQIPSNNASLVTKLQRGKATLGDLQAGGATQVSAPTSGICSPGFPATFDVTGNWTAPLYAASVPGVLPTACISWFQAEQACALSGKRLITNQEWQRAAAGTPDPGTDNGTSDCNVSSLVGRPVPTGSRASCKSSWGAYDMVGNVWEWVADWDEIATVCSNWSTTFGGDRSCVGGDGSFGRLPTAPIRGGSWSDGLNAGVFAVNGFNRDLSEQVVGIGFRCAR